MSAEGPEFNPAMQADEALTPFDVSRSSEKTGLLKLFIGFCILMALIYTGIKLYQPGVRDRGDPPLITADNTPFKIIPEDPGGVQTPDQDKEVFDVMSGEAPSTDVITLPPPEEPIDLPETTTDPVSDPDPVIEQPVVTQPERTQTPAEPVRQTPSADVQPQRPAVKPTPGRSEWLVQVASLRTPGEADSTYAAIRARHSAIIGDYYPDIVRVDLDDKGIYYRARVAGFASREVAAETCERLKAAGQSCFVTRR